MKKHRVRIVDQSELTGEKTFWLEMRKDFWLPLLTIPSHKAIHAFLADEKKQGVHTIGFATRSFSIGIIKDEYKEYILNPNKEGKLQPVSP